MMDPAGFRRGRVAATVGPMFTDISNFGITPGLGSVLQ